MTKSEQLKSMVDNYAVYLEDANNIDEVISYVSEKIYEANKVVCNKGYNYPHSVWEEF